MRDRPTRRDPIAMVSHCGQRPNLPVDRSTRKQSSMSPDTRSGRSASSPAGPEASPVLRGCPVGLQSPMDRFFDPKVASFQSPVAAYFEPAFFQAIGTPPAAPAASTVGTSAPQLWPSTASSSTATVPAFETWSTPFSSAQAAALAQPDTVCGPADVAPAIALELPAASDGAERRASTRKFGFVSSSCPASGPDGRPPCPSAVYIDLSCLRERGS